MFFSHVQELECKVLIHELETRTCSERRVKVNIKITVMGFFMAMSNTLGRIVFVAFVLWISNVQASINKSANSGGKPVAEYLPADTVFDPAIPTNRILFLILNQLSTFS